MKVIILLALITTFIYKIILNNKIPTFHYLQQTVLKAKNAGISKRITRNTSKYVKNPQHTEHVVCQLFFLLQLAQHNKELAALLKPSEKSEPQQPIDKAVEHYANHTAQIEVCILTIHNMVCY